MGVTTKSIIFIGKEFRNEDEATLYFKSKIKLTENDLDEMGLRLNYWLDARKNKDFPQCGSYSIFTGDENCGYYIGYNVYDSNPEKMQQKIANCSVLWENMFKGKAKIIQAVLYT